MSNEKDKPVAMRFTGLQDSFPGPGPTYIYDYVPLDQQYTSPGNVFHPLPKVVEEKYTIVPASVDQKPYYNVPNTFLENLIKRRDELHNDMSLLAEELELIERLLEIIEHQDNGK